MMINKNFSGKKTYFTSDWHLGHGNIMKYCKRYEFMTPEEIDRTEKAYQITNPKTRQEALRAIRISNESIELMNDSIIDRTNRLVFKDDYLFILGDFCWTFINRGWETTRKYRERIRCENVFIVLGNHDKLTHYKNQLSGFWGVDKMKEIVVNGQKITLSHFPMLSWNSSQHGAWHLFGHEHGNINEWIRTNIPWASMLDVGVDNHNFYPYSFHEVKTYMSRVKNHFHTVGTVPRTSKKS